MYIYEKRRGKDNTMAKRKSTKKDKQRSTKHIFVYYLATINMLLCYTSGGGTAYPSGAHDYTPGF